MMIEVLLFKGKIVSFSVEGSFDGALTFSITIQSSQELSMQEIKTEQVLIQVFLEFLLLQLY